MKSLKAIKSISALALLGVTLITVNASAQNVNAGAAADAVDNLKTAVLNKIDSDVEITARSFADAENIHTSLVWSDWARPFLDITLGVFDGLTTLPTLETGGVREYLHDSVTAANAGKNYYSLFTSLDRFKQDGANLELAIYGPAYDTAVSSMLDKADATSIFFNYGLYKASIQNDLYGGFGANSPVQIAHKTSEFDRTGGDVFNGVLAARSYISAQFDVISSQLRQAQLPQQRINELVAFFQARKNEILHSNSLPGMGPSQVAYEAFLTKNGTVTKRNVTYNLGTIGQLDQWRLAVLNLFVQTTGADEIGLTSRLVEKAGEFVTDEALTDYTKTVNLDLNVEAVISGQAGANMVLKDATSLGISVGVDQLSTSELADQAQSYSSNSREQINMIPQQMMDSLPGEMSKVLLLTDDSVKYAQLTIAAPVITQIVPGTLQTSASTQHIAIQGGNFKSSGDANASRLLFVDPAGKTYLRTPTYVSATELDYDITVLDAVGNWSVTVNNGDVQSLPFSFTVAPATAQLSALSITVPATMAENSSVQLTATATIGGVQQTVTGTWHEDSSATDISTAGVLTAGDVAGDTVVNISCDYTFNGVTKIATASITVLNSSSGSGSTTTQELITNGGAETGNGNGWQMSGPIVGVNPSFPRTGNYYFVLGEVDSSTDTMVQTITIPANATSAQFSVWVDPYSEDTSSVAVDIFRAMLFDSNNNLLATMGQLSNLDKTPGTGATAYRQIAYDLSSYRGQTVKVLLTSQLNGSGFTSFKVDDISVVATISQASCTYSLSQTSEIWAAAGGNDAFNIIAPSGCSWSASVNASWLHITGGGSGSGTHGIFYSVDANPTTAPRTGVITAGGQFFTVNQNGNQNACSFRLSSTGYSWPAAGGSDSFTVYTDAICWFEIKTNAPWISVSTNEATGTASISYTVQPNVASGARTGTITAGGQTFTITQAGTPPPPGSLASGLKSPTSVAVDDRWVYFTAIESGNGVVSKVLKTGGSETILLSTNFGNYSSVAVNDTDVFCSLFGTRLLKVPKDGGPVTTLFSTNGDTMDGLTVHNGVLYWAESYEGSIRSVSVNGGAVSTLATGSFGAAAIRFDDTNMYWSTFNYPGLLFSQPIVGGSRTTIVSQYDYLSVNPGLAVQGDSVYWTTSGNIYRAPKTGGARQILASALNNPWRMECDGTNLFWVEYATPGGCVKQMPLGGGTVITLATNLANPTALAVDNQNVYIAQGDYRDVGSIQVVAKATPVADTIAPQVYVTAPLSGARVTDSTVAVTGTAVDDVHVATVQFSINGGTWKPASGTTNWAANISLQLGTNYVDVKAVDDAGNLSAEVDVAIIYTVPDVVAPTVSITTPTAVPAFTTNSPTIVLAGTAADDVGVVKVTWSNDRGGSGLATLVGTQWTSDAIPLAIGQNTLIVTAVDQAGNEQQTQMLVDRLSPQNNTLQVVAVSQVGQIQYRFYGSPRATYKVEESTNLVAWFPVATNVVPVTGFFDFDHVISADDTGVFFRVAQPSP